MSYAYLETSASGAAPIELFRFDHGLETFTFTSHDIDHDYDGYHYSSIAISRDEVDQSQEDTAGSLSIKLPANEAVAQLFMAYLPIVPVGVRVYRMHEGSAEVVTVFAGTVSAASFEDASCTLTCEPLIGVLAKIVPTALYQPQCNHTLFSQSVTGLWQATGCTLKKENFKHSGVIEGISGTALVCSAFAEKPDGYFTYGFLEHPVTGETRWVVSHTGNTVVLVHPYSGLAVGDLVYAYPGCDGAEMTCRAKFNNIVNFSGFTRMPTKNPFNSSIA